MNKYKEISKNTAIFAIGNISIKLIQFFLLPLLTAKLTLEDYNNSDLLISTLELLIPLFTLGLAEAIFRFSINTDYEHKKVFNNSMLITVLGIVPVVISVCVANFIYPENFWYIYSALYAVSAIDNVVSSYVRGVGKIKTFAFSGIVQSLSLALFAFIFVYVLNYGIVGYLIALIIAYAVRIILIVLFGKLYKVFSFKCFDFKLLKIMIIYSLPIIPNNISWFLVHIAHKYICTGFLGDEVAGLFGAASKLPAIINMLATIFLQAWSISTAKTVNDEDKGQFNTTVFKYLSAFVTICVSVVFIILPYISRFLLQGDFYEGWTYSAILMFAAILSCYASYFGAFYGANFKTGMVFISTLVGAVINIAVSFAFVKLIGIYAFLLSSCLTYLAIVIIRLITTKKYSNIKINYFVELTSLTIVLAQALIITFAGSIWWLQLCLCILLILVRIKDIIYICKTLLNLFKRKKPAEAVPADNVNELMEDSDAEVDLTQQADNDTDNN